MIRTILVLPLIFYVLAISAISANAAGEMSGTGISAASEAELVTAPVEIDGQVLFRVRGASSFPADQRAAAIRNRIEAAAADPSIRSDMLRSVDSGNFTTLLASDRLLMIVTDADARMEQLSRAYLVKVHLARIRQAVGDYRSMRNRDALLRGSLYAVAATALLVLGIMILLRLGRRLEEFLNRRVRNRIHSLGIQSFEVVRAEHIWVAIHGMLYSLRVAAILTMSFIYLHYVLALFPWTRGLANRLFELITTPLTQMGKAVVDTIPNLLTLFILFIFFLFFLRLLRLFFDAVAQEKVQLSGFDADWAHPTYKIVRFLLLVFGLVVAYPYIPGSGSAAFKGISIFFGVVFSLGSTSLVSNIIAGYMMIYRRAFKIGDRVKIGDVLGDVTMMRLQVTHLRTLKNEEVSIPNSKILSGHVVNYSSLAREKGLILHTTVGIGYETPWRQVEAMLLLAAERTAGLLRDPSPFVLQKELGDFAIVYELNVCTDNPSEMMKLYTDLHREILDVFNDYGVQIMTPAYRSDTPEPKIVPQEQWYAPPAKKSP
ncbi:Mechanosensitive ion channel [Syntrophus gentianae]|uniref:Mechanosensitive ion channel n=1 Tax=Syntrophus gentianae TaxID=43775 RepID=A0A1H7VNT9_9BACT|nr:mechanosensitive ion channel family protein [Syntrophus gentianae]SEM10911.1 Mechanosensitive ion channel [Syntrophus gentianae]